MLKGYFAIGDTSSMQVFVAKDIHEDWESLASEDSGRTLDGVMHIYWVKPNLKKFEIVMPPCSAETIRRIIELVQGKEYYLSIFDPSEGDKTYHVYTSNAKADMYSGVIRDGLYENFEFHAIEIGD